MLLRIEDIDQSRARPAWEAQIYDDLTWLGLHWPIPVMRQSDRLDRYAAALDQLWEMGVLYPCTCRRRDIEAALSAPQEGAPILGPDGLVYPGTCRTRHARIGPRPRNVSLRLDMAVALNLLGGSQVTYTETGPYNATLKWRWSASEILTGIGDVVVSRREFGTSYHLSVVVDDADQGITTATRGVDLADATIIHVILQRLMGLSSCDYHHHHLIRDTAGKRLAKRDDARAIARYRADGLTPDELREMLQNTLVSVS